MLYSEYIVLDVETTGVNAKIDDIIEFAAVRLNGHAEIVGELNLLISTNQEISPTVVALTGITPADLVGQPTIAEAMDQIRKFIGSAPIVGHNIGFDIEFLNNNKAELTNPALDTLELAYTVLPSQSYYSLEYMAHSLGFPHQPSHRAMADLLATVDLFKFLVQQTANLKPTTRRRIAELVPETAWTWGWLIAQPPAFTDLKLTPRHDGDEIDGLVKEIKSAKPSVEQIATAQEGKINFIETHFDDNPTALTLAYASVHHPAIVIVPDRLFYQTNWTRVGKTIKTDLVPRYPSNLWYRTDAEVDLVKDRDDLSALEAKLVAKVVIWREEWGMDYSRLYLSRDEQYQWEQKLSPHNPGIEPTGDILITSANGLLDMTDLDGRNLVTAHPLLLEDALFASQSRTFSALYFAAAVSSRRDFVHQHIRVVDVKLADSLFKSLNHFGGDLQTVTEALVGIYTIHPPVSVYERNIELMPDLITDGLKTALTSAADHLTNYLEGIKTVTSSAGQAQAKRTSKLIDDFRAVAELSADRRYFLFVDGNRFFLEIVPAQSNLQILHRLIDRAGGLTVLGPGLSVSGSFAYLNSVFGEGTGKIVGQSSKTELVLAQDMPEGNDYSYALHQLAERTLERDNKILFLLNSAYEARQLFGDLFVEAQATKAVLENYDTVGNASLIPELLSKHSRFVLLGHYYWFDRVQSYASGFDRLILGKIPFEAVSRPQAKVLSDVEDGFETYTLARGIMRLKEILHQVKRLKLPLVILDSRLLTKEYGQKVLNSLPDFMVIPEPTDQILG